MPQLQLVTPGLAQGDSQNNRLGLPSIEGVVMDLLAVNVIRGQGLETTDGQRYMVGLSHQTDFPLTNDSDDFIGNIIDNDMFWAAELGRNASVFDVFPEPVAVAGPQAFIVFNGVGATTAARIVLWFRTRRLGLNQWTLLKTLTSYEGVA